MAQLLTQRLGEATVELYAPQERVPGEGGRCKGPGIREPLWGAGRVGLPFLKRPTAAFVVRGC